MKEKQQKFLKPPDGFKPAGDVQWATFLAEQPQFIHRGPRRGAKGRGIVYENKMHKVLEERYGYFYLPGPWVLFGEGPNMMPRYCQPDGILFDFYKGKITIVEIKLKHCALAWWQLYRLYLPVLKKIFGADWEYACCEIVRWYDPAISVPAPTQLRKSIDIVHSDIWGVYICDAKGY